MKQLKNKWTSFLKMLPLIVCILLIIGYLASGRDISVQMILDYTPANPFLAACMILILYAVKSISVVFPLMILRLVTGHLFPTATALFINIMGMIVCLSVPYGIGRFSGTDTINQLKKKHPKIESLLSLQQSNNIFLCFFLRIISCLPGDVVSMYFGATQVPFLQYLPGSLLGTLPNIITATFMGSSITDPSSPMFIISAGLTILLAGSSLLVHYIYKRK